MNGHPGQPKHNHHFTPVLYLKNFTDASGLLHVVRRQDGCRFSTGPKGVGYERDLYSPDALKEGEDPNVYEDQFSEFEGKAAPVIQEIVATRAMPTDREKLQLLFDFIAFQYVRTPSARRMVAAPREQAARIIMDLLVNSEEIYESEMRRAGYDLEKHPHQMLKEGSGQYEPRLTTEGFIDGAMTMLGAIRPYLYRRTWTVLVSERPGESFVVSDHPVQLEWSHPRARRFPPGHAHTETELSFPLSSEVAIIGCYEPLDFDPAYMPCYVSGVNSRTIDSCRIFIAAREDRFIMQADGRIITSEQFIEDLKSDQAGRRS
jgi:hypothetical protein